MPLFDISFLRGSRPAGSGQLEAFFLTVDWPFLPREGEGVEILEDFEAQTVDSVGYGVDGSALVHLGRVSLTDLQVKQLSKAGWRVETLPVQP